MIYLALTALPALLSWRYDCWRRPTGNRSSAAGIWLWIMFLMLTLTAGLRHRLGVDSVVYENMYAGWPGISTLSTFDWDSSRFQPLFIVLVSLPRSLSSDFLWMQILEAVAVNAAVVLTVSRISRRPFLLLLFYVVFLYLQLNFEVLREGVAVALFLIAWLLWRKGETVSYLALTAVAGLLHPMAFALLLLPVIRLQSLKPLFTPGLPALAALVAVFGCGFLVAPLTEWIAGLPADIPWISERAAAYVAEGGPLRSTLNPYGYLGLGFIYVAVPYLALHRIWRHPSCREGDGLTLVVTAMTGIMVCALSLGAPVMRRYFDFLGIFMLAAVAQAAMTRLRDAIVGLLWLALRLYTLTSPLPAGAGLRTYRIYWPYTSRLNPESDPARERAIEILTHPSDTTSHNEKRRGLERTAP